MSTPIDPAALLEALNDAVVACDGQGAIVVWNGAAERIFLELCQGRDVVGTTGVERARSYVRKHCGNVDGLSGALAPRGPAA